ncbi:DNA mismatch repair protein MutL [Erysipelothrix larvae]|uniref:DNA mismatch repair protein MutL n=1 Tax=Erysipelothrix larvae TaxID=1514105 RepID=A0A0X8GXX3_9FIRM|nr:DNA mismatch repair endonuclease MutL [Erysipelothrix larvae]AMC92450.1 DNA mismatch repair protein MutL [Erysipelothrix larvae]
MAKIQVMDAHLANMIAAGEVVERPSGIVKELVENSLDAQATHIEIHVREGGMQEIAVIDNGEGMDEEDLKNAFKRHSTSKVSKAQDLSHIHTFGFRGEALPSIASVSIVNANSHDGQKGHEIVIDNGQEISFQRFARNKGTTVRITSLFSKVPARLKYIKNVRYEYSIIVDIVQKFAMSNPHVSFILMNDGAETFRTYGTGQLKDVFLQVFGPTIARDSKSFQGETFDFKIEGILALPQHNRANRYALWIYLNGRMVRIPKVQNAIIEAYKRYMPQGRFPIAVINITVDPHLVDVNVHPSKWEVRISKEEDLIQCVLNTIENSLNTTTVTARVFKEKPREEQVDFKQDLIETTPAPFVPVLKSEEETLSVTQEAVIELNHNSEETETDYEPIILEDLKVEEDIEDVESSRIEPLTVLSQMSGKYILAQGDQGLYIIDQHAAMERIRYEYYQSMLLHNQYPTQPLLMPVLLEGRQKALSRLGELIQIFNAVQIDIEPFDETSLIVREIPAWLKDADVKSFAEEILDTFEEEKTVDIESMRRLSIATLACHSSVRFNEYLSQEEMQQLIESLRRCEQPFHCPHGRPTLILMDHHSLEREFKR